MDFWFSNDRASVIGAIRNMGIPCILTDGRSYDDPKLYNHRNLSLGKKFCRQKGVEQVRNVLVREL